jgi:5'-nucleotidase
MIRRRLIPVCVAALFGILLVGQDCPAQTDPCDPDPCQTIPNAVGGTCVPIGGSCTPATDFFCSCDVGAWQDATHTCEKQGSQWDLTGDWSTTNSCQPGVPLTSTLVQNGNNISMSVNADSNPECSGIIDGNSISFDCTDDNAPPSESYSLDCTISSNPSVDCTMEVDLELCEVDLTRYPLRILVTNDDGFGAEGIDAIVTALAANPNNDVLVCAPDRNRSGSSDNTNCGTLETVEEETISGYPATTIDGCPADAVNYALGNLYTPDEQPHVVISGINAGQNVSAVVATISGTIGAAKTAARSGVPALASSLGYFQEGSQFDYPSGVGAVLQWLSENRETLTQGGGPPTDMTSINIPSCDGGTIRGTRIVPLAPTNDGFVDPQDCESSLENPANDVEALLNGFITRTSIPLY